MLKHASNSMIEVTMIQAHQHLPFDEEFALVAVSYRLRFAKFGPTLVMGLWTISKVWAHRRRIHDRPLRLFGVRENPPSQRSTCSSRVGVNAALPRETVEDGSPSPSHWIHYKR